MLTEERRVQLDGIVHKMIQNKEPDSNIQFVVDDFKKKYSNEQPTVTPKKDLLQKATDVVTSIFPGKKVGESIGTLGGLAYEKAKGLVGGQDNSANYDISAPSPLQVGGDVAAGAATIAGLKLPAPVGVLKSAMQYGALGGIGSGGESLSKGNDLGPVVKDTAIGGGIGGAIGGVFNLLGKGVSVLAKKAEAPVLSFTSGVPKQAIEQASKNPEIAKQGIKFSVPQIREKAVNSLSSLQKDLSNEFSDSLDVIKKNVPDITKSVGQEAPNAIPEIKNNLLNVGKNLAREFRVSFAKGEVNFSKSNIVNPGEQNNVKQAINTLQTWQDFSPRGVQDLAERIGALRNFDSGAQTKASAIVGKIYNNIAGNKGIIDTLYPELHQLRTNYAVNRKVLNEISNVLSAGKDKPTEIQSSITRLDNLFKENRDVYVNAIKQLADRSGIDYLSLLAGGEFQKILPNYIRGVGGAATVGVASYFNPFAILLAPLFSPRGVGAIVRNAPSIGKTASVLTRSATTQTIQKSTPK